MTKHIVMPLTNDYPPDPRVEREARSLLSAGYRVTIIAWDREAKRPAHETQNGLDIIRVHTVRSAYGSGWRQLFYLPRFWQAAIRLTTQLQPDAIHCHDLDTLYIGRTIKRRLHIPLIYDAHEHYPALMSLYLPRPFITALTHWEKWLLKNADHIFTASTVLQDELQTQTAAPVQTLGNYANTHIFTPPIAQQTTHQQHNLPPDQLIVAFIAKFSRNRRILPFVQAAAHLPHVAFHLWGDGIQRAEIEAEAQKYNNVTWHGWANPADLPKLFQAVDVIYYALRLDYPGAIYNAPNTLSQAMSTATPIIANNVGDLGRIITATNCGLLLDEPTPEAIAHAITQLQDPELRQQLGQNGRRSAEQTYNDAHNRDIIVSAYQNLFNQR